MTTQQAQPSVLAHNDSAARTWSSGGRHYDAISRQIADAIEHCVSRLDPQPGERILDVATGTGWTARRVAARGAQVTGVDFAEEAIAVARELGPDGVDFQVGDAEALPFPDGHFDGVISTFGAMFAGDQRSTARELARVCVPGGRVAMANWTPDSSVVDMFRVIRSYMAGPAPATSPFAWGDTAHMTDLLGEWLDLGFERGTCFYHDTDGAAAWRTFERGYGPVVTLLEQLDEASAGGLRRDFEALHDAYRTALGIRVPRDYVIALGRRQTPNPG